VKLTDPGLLGMTSSFTPLKGFGPADEQDWTANLGMLNWDDSSIVFTKRNLVEFLRRVGVTVDPSWKNMKEIPRYAKLGQKLDTAGTPLEPSASTSSAAPSSGPVQGGFKPSRRVRQNPGGITTLNIFGESDESPPFPPATQATSPKASEPPTSDNAIEEQEGSANKEESVASHEGPRPSRRVREVPGGKDSINDILGDY